MTELKAIFHLLQAHSVALGFAAAFVLTCAANALPLKGQQFVFSQFLIAFIKELAQRVEKTPPMVPVK